jgi:3-dehydroquinate synthetase
VPSWEKGFPVRKSRDDITRLLHDWSHGDAVALPLLVEARMSRRTKESGSAMLEARRRTGQVMT